MKKVMENDPISDDGCPVPISVAGNIRELQNVVERAVIISPGPVLSVDVSDLRFPKDSRAVEQSASPNRQMACSKTF